MKASDNTNCAEYLNATPSPLVRRLIRRHTEPLGVIDVHYCQKRYAKIVDWLNDRFPMLAQLMLRYSAGNGQPLEPGALIYLNPVRSPGRLEIAPFNNLPSKTTSAKAKIATHTKHIETSVSPVRANPSLENVHHLSSTSDSLSLRERVGVRGYKTHIISSTLLNGKETHPGIRIAENNSGTTQVGEIPARTLWHVRRASAKDSPKELTQSTAPADDVDVKTDTPVIKQDSMANYQNPVRSPGRLEISPFNKLSPNTSFAIAKIAAKHNVSVHLPLGKTGVEGDLSNPKTGAVSLQHSEPSISPVPLNGKETHTGFRISENNRSTTQAREIPIRTLWHVRRASAKDSPMELTRSTALADDEDIMTGTPVISPDSMAYQMQKALARPVSRIQEMTEKLDEQLDSHYPTQYLTEGRSENHSTPPALVFSSSNNGVTADKKPLIWRKKQEADAKQLAVLSEDPEINSTLVTTVPMDKRHSATQMNIANSEPMSLHFTKREWTQLIESVSRVIWNKLMTDLDRRGIRAWR